MTNSAGRVCPSGAAVFSGAQKDRKKKKPVTVAVTGYFLELLPGFGPGTSSLPILLHCVFAHVSFCSLSQFTQCFQCIERLANIYLL